MMITRYGRREAVLFSVASVGLAGLAWLLHPPLAVIPAVLLLFVLSFFRDPERRTPPDERTLVSPADGTVTDVTTAREESYLLTEATRIGIFLSVFDVHVNRSPVAGRVEHVSYRPGRFRNAMDAEACSKENEANLVGIRGDGGVRVLVKQIAGTIARRIVCPLEVGASLRRGERFGMIKFGSRTELFVPADLPFELRVHVGEHVKGGETVIGVLKV
jgi:phosphatidylserine decarboxylase